MAARQQSVQRLEELVKIAQSTKGWVVTHGERTVYFGPPGCTRDELISMSVAPGEYKIKELEKTLEKAGLPMSLPKNPAHPRRTLTAVPAPAPTPDVTQEPEVEIEPVVPSLICPECGQPTKSPAGLGAHRRRKHNVIGTSADAIKKRNQQAEDAGEGDQPEPTTEEVVDTVLSDVDAAMVLLRAEVEAVIANAREGVEEESAWQRRAEEAGETLGKIREAIDTLPMAQAFARISEVVGADRS